MSEAAKKTTPRKVFSPPPGARRARAQSAVVPVQQARQAQVASAQAAVPGAAARPSPKTRLNAAGLSAASLFDDLPDPANQNQPLVGDRTPVHSARPLGARASMPAVATAPRTSMPAAQPMHSAPAPQPRASRPAATAPKKTRLGMAQSAPAQLPQPAPSNSNQRASKVSARTMLGLMALKKPGQAR